MGTTIEAKQKWIEENYDQIKLSASKDLVKEFKEKCHDAKIPMAQVLKQAMMEFCELKMPKIKPIPKKPQVDTRQKRRKAIAFAIEIIEEARDAETAYLEAIPENLQNSSRYEDAQASVAALEEATQALEGAYS